MKYGPNYSVKPPFTRAIASRTGTSPPSQTKDNIYLFTKQPNKYVWNSDMQSRNDPITAFVIQKGQNRPL